MSTDEVQAMLLICYEFPFWKHMRTTLPSFQARWRPENAARCCAGLGLAMRNFNSGSNLCVVIICWGWWVGEAHQYFPGFLILQGYHEDKLLLWPLYKKDGLQIKLIYISNSSENSGAYSEDLNNCCGYQDDFDLIWQVQRTVEDAERQLKNKAPHSSPHVLGCPTLNPEVTPSWDDMFPTERESFLRRAGSKREEPKPDSPEWWWDMPQPNSRSSETTQSCCSQWSKTEARGSDLTSWFSKAGGVSQTPSSS